MTLTIIIIVCTLLLIAYLFDLSSSKTRIPSVILLLVLGFGSRQIANALNLEIPDLSAFLTIFGTLGLILIVLEGSIDLEVHRSKLPFVAKSVLTAFVPIVVMSLLLTLIFSLFNDSSFRLNMLNILPFCVISSAIAIPSVKHICKIDKEFIIYESSFSDIIGVLFFTFLLTQQNISLGSFGVFGLELLLMFVISFVATVTLVILLSKITNHIKFAPITILVILIYAVAEVYHLPALIFIFIFGLLLGNINKIERIKLIQRLNPTALHVEVRKFKELVTEGAFLIRSMFFLIFGFLIETSELLNAKTFLYAILIVSVIFAVRYGFLRLMKMNIDPLLFVAPRGLITILLFLSIPTGYAIPQINRSLIIQVIVLTAVILMIGLMLSKSGKIKKIDISQDHHSDVDELDEKDELKGIIINSESLSDNPNNLFQK